MLFRVVLIAAAVCLIATGSEADAVGISHRIQARHAPFGAILDPIFQSSTSEVIAGYTRCGDSAIWTGHYLAAEAYRYKATGSAEALANAQRAIEALDVMVRVTGTNLLARCAVPVNWAFASGIVTEEQHNGSHVATLDGRQYYWIGHTSRDQYSGALFGLAVAYDLIREQSTRDRIADLVTRMVDFLRHNDWNVQMPDGSFSTTFAIRPDQQLTILQIARQVNSHRFNSPYKLSAFFGSLLVSVPIAVDVSDVNDSYFKFNLDTINLFSLLRWETSGLRRSLYDAAYSTLAEDNGRPWQRALQYD